MAKEARPVYLSPEVTGVQWREWYITRLRLYLVMGITDPSRISACLHFLVALK